MSGGIYSAKKAHTAGAIGDYCLSFGFPGALFSPLFCQIGVYKADCSPFPAAKGLFPFVSHFFDGEPRSCNQLASRLMNLGIIAGGTRIMDANNTADGLNIRQQPCGQNLVDGPDLQRAAIILESSVAAGARNQDSLDPMLRQKLQHLSEHGFKVLPPAEIMRWLGAAVQNNSQRW